jgi:hypothetical protein
MTGVESNPEVSKKPPQVQGVPGEVLIYTRPAYEGSHCGRSVWGSFGASFPA